MTNPMTSKQLGTIKTRIQTAAVSLIEIGKTYGVGCNGRTVIGINGVNVWCTTPRGAQLAIPAAMFAEMFGLGK